MHTNLDIYVFIHIPHSFITCYDCQVYSFKFYVLLLLLFFLYIGTTFAVFRSGYIAPGLQI